jgi:hypothetical protein
MEFLEGRACIFLFSTTFTHIKRAMDEYSGIIGYTHLSEWYTGSVREGEEFR